MKHSLRTRKIRYVLVAVVALICVVGLLSRQTDALRFQDRSMYIGSSLAGDTTFYQISFTYPTTNTVGSLRLEFCDNPIPTLPCNVPAGLDITGATLSAQSGETGFSISQQTSSVIVLSRTPSTTGITTASYRFDNMVNPSAENQDFYVRMTDYASTDASGSSIDFGSVTARLVPAIEVYSQVPPILVFCVAGTINDDNCEDTAGNFADYGELSSNQTHTTATQILARTNAQYGYNITVSGRTMTSGINEIPTLLSPTESFRGVGQFGINLAANSQPAVGADPVGPGVGATLNSNYTQANKFLFRDGDTLVTSTGVTPARKFTASYIVNVPANQPPGVYSTTISYTCLAGF